ncbi:MAG: polyphosphate kinase 1 [Bacteroidia bacterium]|nr:polyphosphate kinase 1 [Bacteroidia bacterium]MDW8235656.1 polyphosphate kinase 1 [Bacteroidia bacterium]
MGSLSKTSPFRNPELSRSELFFNRELSWLEFNARVLEEALHEVHPLLSRTRFVSIFHSNLDEFFMIRVAGLKEQIQAGVRERGPDGLTPRQTLQKVREKVRRLLERAEEILYQHLLPALEAEGISIYQGKRLSRLSREQLEKYFEDQVFPLLTPLALDSAHPVPPLRGLELILWVELKDGSALVPIPQVLPRFVPFHTPQRYNFVPIESLIGLFLEELFPGKKVKGYHVFRLTRDADLEISEAEADDLLQLVERELRRRRLGNVVRMEYSAGMPRETLYLLMEELEFAPEDTYEVRGMLGLGRLWDILEVDEPSLLDRPFVPVIPPALQGKTTLFEAIAQSDILLHHPYDSFMPVVEFIRQAARDPQVLAIKQTLYRTTGEKSLIVQALREAIDRGKQVTVLIELKARFDEESNIYWARELEKAGANVVYGMLGLKIHGKATLVIRREGKALRGYAHLSTGNYNERTALIYTDIGLLTADPEITRDLAELFNYLTGNSGQKEWRRIAVAPENLRETFLSEIERCISEHTSENSSRILLVLNALVDPEMIKALYAASMAGVKVDLVVRGICCLVPDTPASANIRVHSIIGRFLEHSRLYIFQSGGSTRVWSGSADWMPRNLDRRVEVVYPIAEPLAHQALHIAETLLKDTTHAWTLRNDGTYVRRTALEPHLPAFSAQNEFLKQRNLLKA